MLWDIPLDVVKMWANNAPLIAALLAPASTLYDIPALSQRWYSLNGVEQTDPSASLILSAFSLSASITANALLILRFSIRWSKVSQSLPRYCRIGPYPTYETGLEMGYSTVYFWLDHQDWYRDGKSYNIWCPY
jgi:hypothetical protein